MIGRAQSLFAPAAGLHIERMDGAGFIDPFRNFVDANHSYINFHDRPARSLRWLCYEGRELVGAFELSSAWTMPKDVRAFMSLHALEFNEVANNSVYCLAGATTKNAASQFLALLRRDAVQWWMERYGGPLRALQTFILPPRTGACYRADNWQRIGTTVGTSQQTETIREPGQEMRLERTFSAGGTPKIILARYPAVREKRS